MVVGDVMDPVACRIGAASRKAPCGYMYAWRVYGMRVLACMIACRKESKRGSSTGF